MPQRREKWLVGAVILLFLIIISAPYLVAQASTKQDLYFSGFLLNPVDGHSYLAKMRQGLEGAWFFTLPYTAEPGAGAAINLYYLFLGHISGGLAWSLLFTFHASRVAGALLLALALYRLFARVFSQPGPRLVALVLTLFGSGLGWLAISLGGFSSDFWVAEAYPFLASYTNPHFALGLAIQVWLLTPLQSDALIGWQRLVATAGAAAMLSILYPFGWAVAAAVWTAWVAWQAWRRDLARAELRHWGAILLGGAPYALYAYLVIRSHPVLALWDAQNLTPAPPLLDTLLALSPALILAALGAGRVFREGESQFKFLALWLIVGIALVYLPLNFQRRLISGWYIPVGALAVYALAQLSSATVRRFASLALLFLALPTNAIIILGGLNAVSSQQPALTSFQPELAAFKWLEDHAPGNSLVLAAPETSLRLPAYASMQVIYAHPFETVAAGLRHAEVLAFFSGNLTQEQLAEYVARMHIDYLFYGPRERVLGNLPSLPGWHVVYESGDMHIWAPLP